MGVSVCVRIESMSERGVGEILLLKVCVCVCVYVCVCAYLCMCVSMYVWGCMCVRGVF